MLADDVKFWRVVNDIEDQKLLQADMDRLFDWCIRNNLQLCVEKCCYSSFSRKLNRIDTAYHIDSKPLRYVSSIRDLGVIMDEKLSFVEHINSLSVKASKLLGFVKRNSKYFSIDAVRLIYCCLVRSILEYCSVVWSPYHQIHIATIEKVQHKFLKYCAYKTQTYIENHDYTGIEQRLSLAPLSVRRDISGGVFVFKIINGLIDCPSLLDSIRFNVPYPGLRYNVTFNTAFHRTSYGSNMPLDRYMCFLNGFDMDLFNISLGQLRRSLAM
uniref:Uncharacterized protein LOC114343445 n=1 Tax=Diabrotica virgifera virgifera TaxID=50390 RepID=A0A6P7GJH9_DIAVI